MRRQLGVLIMISLLTLTFFGSMISVVSAVIDPSYECTFTSPAYVKSDTWFTVRGTLTQNGNPVPLESLDIVEVDTAGGVTNIVGLVTATTQSDGSFSALIRLPLGDHILRAADDTTQHGRYQSDDVTVHADTYSISLTASPNPATTTQSIDLSGQLTTSTGAGVGMQALGINEIVTTDDTISTIGLGSTTTEADGSYSATIGPLSAGDHTIYVKMGVSGEGALSDWALSENEIITVTTPASSTVTTAEVAYGTYGLPYQGVVVGGTVKTQAGDAVTAGDVEIWRQAPGETSLSFWQNALFYTSNNPEGSFAMTPVPLDPGTYKFQAKYTGGDNFLSSESEVMPLTVTDQQDHKQDAIDTATTLINDPTVASALLGKNNHKPFDSKLQEVIGYINTGDYTTALSKLQNDLIAKTDGVPLTEMPHKNDWVKADQQTAIYNQLQSIKTSLEQLQA